MSAINTNGINVNYPTPGVNNSTQGFRDNFASIKNNLTTAKTEIADIQSKVVVKSALTGVPLNNDMANTLISNALVRSFRATTFPIGNDLRGQITIDVSKGDVQYGTVTEDVTINFGGWSPTNTQSNVQLNLNIANSLATIHFPDSLYQGGSLASGMTKTAFQLENYGSQSTVNGQNETLTNQVTVPYGVTELQYSFGTTDCGTTIDVYPLNRSSTASRINLRVPNRLGSPGDAPGAICTDGSALYICVGTYDGETPIWGGFPIQDVLAPTLLGAPDSEIPPLQSSINLNP